MQQILLIAQFFIAIVLVVLVLVQRGKGADMGAAFGSGASSTVFGSKGSMGFLMKLTFFIGALFFATSMGLTYLAAKEAKASHKSTVLTNVEQIAKQVQKHTTATIKKIPAVKLKKPIRKNKTTSTNAKKSS